MEKQFNNAMNRVFEISQEFSVVSFPGGAHSYWLGVTPATREGLVTLGVSPIDDKEPFFSNIINAKKATRFERPSLRSETSGIKYKEQSKLLRINTEADFTGPKKDLLQIRSPLFKPNLPQIVANMGIKLS